MNGVIYTQPLLPEYEGNLLIEALPSMGRTDQELLEAMKQQPAFSVAERTLPASVRREMTYRLRQLFIPLPIHFELLQELSICVRRSYVWRNPLRPQAQAFLHHPGVSAIAGDFLVERTASSHLLLVKGISGIGKSTAIESCLRALGPQVIRHTRYRGTAINETQVVWVKVSCPEDRSLKTLCTRILQAADAALGERTYAPQYLADPRITTGVLIHAVFQCLANVHIGVLAVDEMQNLFASKGQPAQELLNFLLRLKDEGGICLVLCGTYAALELLNRKFRLSRRIAGSEVELKMPMSASDEEWNGFAEILWGYQWLAEPEAYSEEHAQVLFDLTRGIRGVVVSLFIVAQGDAIRCGKRSLTTTDLRNTWNRRFGRIHEAMSALRSGTPANLSKWDDLCDALTLQELIDAKKARTASGSPLLQRPATEAKVLSDKVAHSKGPPRRKRTGAKPRVDASLGKLTQPEGLDELMAEGIIGLPPE